MKIIELTQGYVAWVDDEDYEGLACFCWHAVQNRGSVYARRLEAGTNRLVYMHRQILQPPPGADVDHRVHRSDLVIDNRRSNLRLTTPSGNGANNRKRRGTAVPFKGVSRHRAKYQASIRVMGKAHHLGTFTRESDAALAYDLAAVKHFGEFALTNFPVPGSTNWIFGPDCATLSA